MCKIKLFKKDFISIIRLSNILFFISLLSNVNGFANNTDLNIINNESNSIKENNSIESTISTQHINDGCIQKCKEENRTNSEHIECGQDCYIQQCSFGCTLWEIAFDSSCQNVCKKSNDDPLDPKEFYCVIGCNEATNNYFKWLRYEVGTPSAPALAADTLTATSLSLEWEIPKKLLDITRSKSYSPKSYLVQWRYEEVDGDWKFCRNQSMSDDSPVSVDNLQPYTKYRFRVALLLAPNSNEVLVSEQSVIINTRPAGKPLSEPTVRAVAVDHTRISVSWEPGPFPNGPILSYALEIKIISSSDRYTAFKDIPVTENINYYLFEKLLPSSKYSIEVSMRNAEGEGPKAYTAVQTASAPPINLNKTQPKLILGGEYSIMFQTTELLIEPPKTYYESPNKILGVAMHISKSILFVSDEGRNIFKLPISLQSDRPKHRETIISNETDINFIPTLLTVDWLNDHLYILGEVEHPNAQIIYQISRCNLNGQSLTVAIAGLYKKPNHMQVDPLNGYLFWVVSGNSMDSGLFRLDLGDISNGVKHEVRPLQLIQGENLGAFVVDFTRFKLLVPAQNDNTIYSVTLDGKDKENIRNNTQSPQLRSVKSLALANGIFLWTNGSSLFMEDHHKEENNYYHNAYPSGNKNFITVNILSSTSQPIPVPVNPPREVQALLSSRKAVISWNIPHLLGNQGKGSWQEWNYELKIVDDTDIINVIRDIKGNHYAIDKLKPNTNYTFFAAAYTISGKGPYSTEFKAKTLKSSHDRYIFWSSDEGLLQSDVTGEHIHTLIPKTELNGHDASEMVWFEDVLFFVSNSSLKYYNRTSNILAKFKDIESVETIGVDWIGKKIYWSNPGHQFITRSNLNGQDKEPLQILAVVKELKIDSLNGHLYYSTGSAVEACRLNGKHRLSYVNFQPYAAQVMGLTLDMENERIFWIVRSFNGSNLYMAPMAKYWSNEMQPIEIPLASHSQSQSLALNRLTYFSDRLLWLQDDHTVIVGDMTGKNLAKIRNEKFSGIKSVAVIDPAHHIFPKHNHQINVLPEQVVNYTIKIDGTWDSFNISWEPIHSVTYGDVFYDIRITCQSCEKKTDFFKEITVPYYSYNQSNDSLPPYTHLDVTVRAFTYWGTAKQTLVRLFTPAAAPSAPTKPRIYINHSNDPFVNDLNITATVRWSNPSKPNGPIKYYRIRCYVIKGGKKISVVVAKDTPHQEFILNNLIKNTTYFFEIQAFTTVDGSKELLKISANSSMENPLPRLVIAKSDRIDEIDFDLKREVEIVHTGGPVAHLSYIAYEKTLLWVNENRDIISFSNGHKIKLATAGSDVLSLAIDWVKRTLYYSLLEENGSAVYYIDLNRYEGKPLLGNKIIMVKGIIKSLVIDPQNQKLFWIQLDDLKYRSGKLVQNSLQSSQTIEFPNELNCLNGVFQELVLDYQSMQQNRLILVSDSGRIYSYGLESNTCELLKLNFDNGSKKIVKDSSNLFLQSGNSILVYKYNKQHMVNFTSVIDLMAYTYQNYPTTLCLLPKRSLTEIELIPQLVKDTDNSLTLQLPQLQLNSHCQLNLTGIKYYIQYVETAYGSLSDCHAIQCKSLIAYEPLIKIEHLKPFTKYEIQIAVTNYYAEKMGIKINFGPPVRLTTAPGAPSKPRYVYAESISPTEAIVKWLCPLQLNGDSIWYVIYWQTENPITRVVNKLHRPVILPVENLIKDSSEQIAISLSKLLPNQKYSIWVQAYSTNETFIDSDVVKVETFSEPQNITVLNTSAYSIELHWETPKNVTKYTLEYSTIDLRNTTEILNSINDTRSENNNFTVDSLQPKTQYRFIVKLFYADIENPYVWPPDNRFLFETLGDRPSAPGKPIIRPISSDVFQVWWEQAKDNGAQILEYSLEALQTRVTNRIRRSTEEDIEGNIVQTAIKDENTAEEDRNAVLDDNPEIPTNNTSVINQIPYAEEPELIEEKWFVYCNGTETHCIKKDMTQIGLLRYRVRARNSYGWGPYSSESEPISEPYISPQRRDTLLIAIGIPMSIVMFFAIFAICMIFVRMKRSAAKKILLQSGLRPDVELANLREFGHGLNMIHTTNILYCPGPLTDADIALLPHIRREQITMSSFLGSGAFGEVYEGIVRNVDDNPETRVAIKTLRKGATEQEKGEFLQEAQLMSNFKHDHILKLIGVCFDSESLLIIMELMQGGDLLSYLRQSRPRTMGVPSALTLLDLISMCVDVASGCRYLEEMHFVHRDLACRNCLVSSVDPQYRLVKIGDFGLARDIYKNDYYRKEGEGLMPVRWMSPESLVDGVFTSYSDIWAFGVLCWEIMTLGQQPYTARNNLEVWHYVRDGGRLESPPDCPEELYDLMLKCWSYRPEERPQFRYCLEVLKQLKAHTNNSVQIFASHDNSRLVNDGVFNPSYFEPDVNHNGNIGSLKFSPYPNGILENHFQEQVILTPASSTTTVIPKYLELLYDEHDDPLLINQAQQQMNLLPSYDGYEIPISSLKDQEFLTCVVAGLPSSVATEPVRRSLTNNNSKERTFSSSSTASRSSSPNLVLINNNNNNNNNLINANRNSLGQIYNDNHINTNLTVALPSKDDCNNYKDTFINKDIDTGGGGLKKSVYSNAPNTCDDFHSANDMKTFM